jgi:hypothetical protein
MSMYFPSEIQLEQSIANNQMLQQPYFKNKGITEAVAELAKKKFVGGNLVELFAKLAAVDVISELRKQKFADEELSEVMWIQVIRATEKTFQDCLTPPKK